MSHDHHVGHMLILLHIHIIPQIRIPTNFRLVRKYVHVIQPYSALLFLVIHPSQWEPILSFVQSVRRMKIFKTKSHLSIIELTLRDYKWHILECIIRVIGQLPNDNPMIIMIINRDYEKFKSFSLHLFNRSVT